MRRKFQDKQVSFALGSARPENLSDRKALLKIDTSILANDSCLLVDTAQVCIRLYRSAPSLAASMSGSLTRQKLQTSTNHLLAQPKLLWQSANLTANAQGVVIVDVECSAKAVDDVLEAHSISGKSSLMKQVLEFLQHETGVKLATKSAKVSCNVLCNALLCARRPLNAILDLVVQCCCHSFLCRSLC